MFENNSILNLNNFDGYINFRLFLLAKLPKWFGERPGKRAGDPETPEGEEDAKVGAEEEELEEEEVEEKHVRFLKNKSSLNFQHFY